MEEGLLVSPLIMFFDALCDAGCWVCDCSERTLPVLEPLDDEGEDGASPCCWRSREEGDGTTNSAVNMDIVTLPTPQKHRTSRNRDDQSDKSIWEGWTILTLHSPLSISLLGCMCKGGFEQ